eukprot:4036303-Pyramimonas_sp.AAC.1
MRLAGPSTRQLWRRQKSVEPRAAGFSRSATPTTNGMGLKRLRIKSAGDIIRVKLCTEKVSHQLRTTYVYGKLT